MTRKRCNNHRIKKYYLYWMMSSWFITAVLSNEQQEDPISPILRRRKQQVIDVSSYAIEFILKVKYISEDTSQSLSNGNRANDVVYSFCSAVNAQAGNVESVTAAYDNGIALFTLADYSYPETGCRILSVTYPSQQWETKLDENYNDLYAAEILVKQTIYSSSDDVNETKPYVEEGFLSSTGMQRFLADLKRRNAEAFEFVEDVQYLNEFSPSMEAPTMAPTWTITQSPTITTEPPTVAVTERKVEEYSGVLPIVPEPREAPSPPKEEATVEASTLADVDPAEAEAEPDAKHQSSTSFAIPVTYIAAIAACIAAIAVAILFILYFFTKKRSERRKRKREEQEKLKQQQQRASKKQRLNPTSPPASIPKVPSFIDINENGGLGDDSTLGEHTAGRVPQKPPPPESLPVQQQQKQQQPQPPPKKPLPLNVDYEDHLVSPFSTNIKAPSPTFSNKTPKTSHSVKAPSPTFSNETPRASSRKNKFHDAPVVSPPESVTARPLPYPEDDLQDDSNVEYDDPDPDMVVVSSDSESEPERIFSPALHHASVSPTSSFPPKPTMDPMIRPSRTFKDEPQIQVQEIRPVRSASPKSYPWRQTQITFPSSVRNAPFDTQVHSAIQNAAEKTMSQEFASPPPPPPPKKIDIPPPKRVDPSPPKEVEPSPPKTTIQQPSVITPPPPPPPPKEPSLSSINDEGSNNNPTPWLFEAVTDTLGPPTLSADLESLGERSRHSQKRHKRVRKSSASVTSKRSGSNSVGSKTSLRSYRSQISKANSEASRNVAKDLLRLETQLAALGKDTVMKDNASVHSFNSKSTTSRQPRNKKSFIKVVAPPGKLGIILANRSDRPGTVVSDVRSNSPLFGKIIPGDRIVGIDGENVSLMPVSEITNIMGRKGEFERMLMVLTGVKR